MGAYLDKPVKAKDIDAGESEKFRYAVTSMQGWRTTQEDAHNCSINFIDGCSLFAVYDGHGGSEVAKYLSIHFPEYLKQNLSAEKDISDELKKIFIDFDATLCTSDVLEILNKMKAENDKKSDIVSLSGSDAVNEKKTVDFRNEMIKEAINLSEESEVDLETLVQGYARYRLVMQHKLGLKRTGTDAIGLSSKKRRTLKECGEEIKCGTLTENGELSSNKESSCDIEMSSQDVVQESQNNDDVTSSTNGDTATIGKSDIVKDEQIDLNGSAMKEIVSKINNNPQNEHVNSTNHSDDELKSNGVQQTHTAGESILITQTAKTEPAAETECSSTVVIDAKPGSSGSKTDLLDTDSSTDDEDADYSPGNGDEETDEAEDVELSAEDSLVITDEEEAEIQDVLSSDNKAGFDSGSTACVALVFQDRLVVANVGDSRAVLCRKNEAFDLSNDHKPEDLTEKQRIVRAGGSVSRDGRVNGGLNLSRAFGDHFYKQKESLSLSEQMITAFPDVMEVQLSDDDSFLVIACDGIWNSMSSQAVVDFIKGNIASKSLKDIEDELCEKCCAADTTGDGTGCDNITIIIVDLKKKTLENGSQQEIPEVVVSSSE